ncbi:hypothetical protein [Enhygromyxa salina]|uniref:hypothetical protein n=1 Tax=Enhygromyxa salina TaxID=215803 RepID=UPI001F0AC8DD|nr:hypothetical protein [Enhygromyxa salina]
MCLPCSSGLGNANTNGIDDTPNSSSVGSTSTKAASVSAKVRSVRPAPGSRWELLLTLKSVSSSSSNSFSPARMAASAAAE